MSSNNNQPSGELVVLVGILMLLWEIFKVVFILAVTGAAVFCVCATLLSLYAWNKPRVVGEKTITPEDARAFLSGACTGLAVTFVVVTLIAAVLNWNIGGNALAVGGLFGYAAGGIEAVDALEKKQAQKHKAQILPPLPRTVPPPPPVNKPPFRYASWDDEAGQ